ncbi:hypothetical protein SDC9_173364 [bioreactor metagenome]|uniref:Uncharacterized protein n=1 Tax=bioreactor metagenome TaxID=1076179 RepID=A0A645GQJ3_9ZZZZ
MLQLLQHKIGHDKGSLNDTRGANIRNPAIYDDGGVQHLGPRHSLPGLAAFAGHPTGGGQFPAPPKHNGPAQIGKSHIQQHLNPKAQQPKLDAGGKGAQQKSDKQTYD